MNEREEWIDNIRGVAIYLVVLGHSIQYLYYGGSDFSNNIIFSIIYSFHMPLFCLISGYLFYNYTQKYALVSGFMRKTRTILIPCLSWGLINYGLSVFMGNDALGFKNMCWFLIYHNWFLWAVFYCSVGTLICLAIDRSLWKISFAVIIIMFMVPDYLNSIDFKMMFPFFITGFFLKKEKAASRFVNLHIRKRRLLAISWVSVYILLMLFLISADDIMAWKVFSIGDFATFLYVCKRWLINIVGSFAVIFTIGAFGPAPVAKKIFVTLGKNTLGIYMVQTFFFAYGSDYLYVREARSVVPYKYQVYFSPM